MYSKISTKTRNLKQHHHISLDAEFRDGCKVWIHFLESNNPLLYCRLFTDLNEKVDAEILDFYMDSMVNKFLGFGGIFTKSWFFGKWEEGYIDTYEPNIEFLELYAVCMGIFIWQERLRNHRIVIHCDNDGVVKILNKGSRKCKH